MDPDSSAADVSGNSADTTQQNSAADTSAPADGAQSAQHSDANSPEQSSGSDEPGAKKERETLLSVVRKALKPEASQDGSSPKPKDGEGSQATTGQHAEEEAPEDAAEAEKTVPFHQHPRWKKVVGERNELRTQLDKVTRDSEPLRKDSEDYRKITGYMEQHGLTPDEVSQGFVIMSLLKNNPAEAWKVIKPISDNLQRFTGELLPDDLKEKVEKGYLDEATARETARLRASHNFNGQMHQQRQQTQQKQQQRQEQQGNAQRLANECSAAVGAWETEIKGKDPDYSRKAAMVEDYLKAMLAQRGWPKSKDEAVALANEAYTLTNRRVKALVPQRGQVTPPPRSASSSTNAQAAPKTLREVVARAARGD